MSDPERSSADRPEPGAQPCAECGHIWFAGERRHVYLDRDGRVATDGEDARVLCTLCRDQLARGER